MNKCKKNVLTILRLGFLGVMGFLEVAGSGVSQAATLMVLEHQENQVAINSDLGTIIQLPSSVKTVTPSKYFQISPAGEAQTDVKTFQVKSVQGKSESVTFVLANGKALAFKLSPLRDADKFVAVEMVPKRPKDAKFLGSEMQMMTAMLRGEQGGYQREYEEESVSSPTDSLKFTLLQTYQGDAVTGYIFLVRNALPESTTLNLSTIGFSTPNQAVLSHADKLQLKPCPLIGKNQDCETILRMVVRGSRERKPVLTHAPAPYAKPSSIMGGSRE